MVASSEVFCDAGFRTSSSATVAGNMTVNGTYDSLYKITTVEISVAAISAHSYVSAADKTMAQVSGYNAVGIVGWSSSTWRVRPTSHYIKSNTVLFAGFANDTNSNADASTVTFKVLWLKATSG